MCKLCKHSLSRKSIEWWTIITKRKKIVCIFHIIHNVYMCLALKRLKCYLLRFIIHSPLIIKYPIMNIHEMKKVVYSSDGKIILNAALYCLSNYFNQ